MSREGRRYYILRHFLPLLSTIRETNRRNLRPYHAYLSSSMFPWVTCQVLFPYTGSSWGPSQPPFKLLLYSSTLVLSNTETPETFRRKRDLLGQKQNTKLKKVNLGPRYQQKVLRLRRTFLFNKFTIPMTSYPHPNPRVLTKKHRLLYVPSFCQDQGLRLSL